MTNLLNRMTRRPGGRISILSIAGLIMVPLIVAGLLIWGLWSPGAVSYTHLTLPTIYSV